MAKKLGGRCACGSIRYQLLAQPMFIHCCHCEDCQRLTGSAFVLNAIIETRAIKLTRGTPVAVSVPQWERGLIPIWDAVNVPCVPPMTDVTLPCPGMPVEATTVLFRSPLNTLAADAPVLSTSFHLPPIFVPVGGGTHTRCFPFVRAAEFTGLIWR